MSLVIRDAEAGDRRDLEVLLAALMREHQTTFAGAYPVFRPDEAAAYFATDYAARLAAADPTLVAVLAVDRAPVGCLLGEVMTRAVGRPATVAFCEWLYVDRDARGQGIGRAIIRAALVHVRAAGATHIEIASVPGDGQWRRRGWQETARRYMAPVGDVAAWVGLVEELRS